MNSQDGIGISVTSQGDGASLRSRHYCPLCNLFFTRGSHLRRHATSHQDQRLFNCSLCSRSFKRRDTLRRHELSHGLSNRDSNSDASEKMNRACISCSKARTKCSRTTPCRRCADRKLQCQFPEATQREVINSTDEFVFAVSATPVSLNTEYGGDMAFAEDNQEPTVLTSVSLLPLSESQQGLDPQDAIAPPTSYTQALASGVRMDYESLPPHVMNDNVMTSINWLSMDTPGDWDFNLDVIAMSQNFQENTTDSTFGMEQDLARTGQFQYEPHVDQGGSQESPCSIQLVNASLDTLPDSDIRTIVTDVSTPVSQAGGSETGRYYAHGHGSRHVRQREVFSRQSVSAGSPSSCDTLPGAPFSIIGVESVINNNNNIGPGDRFPVPSDTYHMISEAFEVNCLRSTHHRSTFSTSSFMSHPAVESCIGIYFKSASLGLPIVHQATLLLGRERWLLALALCTAGCSVLQCPQISRSLLEFLQRALTLETNDWRLARSPEQTLIFAQVNVITCMLSQVQGDGRGFQAENTLAVLATLCRRCGWLALDPFSSKNCSAGDLPSTETEWRSWVFHESQVRLGYAVWLLDQHASMVDETRVYLCFGLAEARSVLPSHEDVWQAVSPEEFCAQLDQFSCSRGLEPIMNGLYQGDGPETGIGDFARTIITHALCRRVLDTRDYQHEVLRLAGAVEPPDVTQQTREGDRGRKTTPSRYEIWRNSTLDCLDILHWRAHEISVKEWGLEPGQVLHLHLARLVLLSPFRDIDKLTRLRTSSLDSAQSDSSRAFLRDTRSHEVSMTNVARWLRQDYFKARLSIIHAGALLWYMKRFSVGSHFEPIAIKLACNTLWAYAAYNRLLQKSSGAAGSQAEDENDASDLPPLIQIDRPCDDGLVQTFIQKGDRISPYMTGVGYLRDATSAARIPRLGADLLSLRCHPWQVCQLYQMNMAKLAEVCAD